MTDDVRSELDAVAAARRRLDKQAALLDERERAAIQAAWREKVPPTEIAARVRRSTAHVRKFRPEDVPPARTGGMAKRAQDKQTGGTD